MSHETHYISINNTTRFSFPLKVYFPSGKSLDLKSVGPHKKVVTDLGNYGGPEKEFHIVLITPEGEYITSGTKLLYNDKIKVTAKFTLSVDEFIPFVLTFDGLEK